MQCRHALAVSLLVPLSVARGQERHEPTENAMDREGWELTRPPPIDDDDVVIRGPDGAEQPARQCHGETAVSWDEAWLVEAGVRQPTLDVALPEGHELWLEVVTVSPEGQREAWSEGPILSVEGSTRVEVPVPVPPAHDPRLRFVTTKLLLHQGDQLIDRRTVKAYMGWDGLSLVILEPAEAERSFARQVDDGTVDTTVLGMEVSR